MFKIVDRNHNDNLVLVPGWAFDYRIFTTLDLPYNYFYFCGQSLADFEDQLKKLLEKNRIEKISLLGWSQGALAVCDFARKNLNISEKIILISLRKKYEKQALENIKKKLTKNRTAWLFTFYKNCFCKEESDRYRWFRNTFLKDYLGNTSSAELINSLDYLAQFKMQPELLKKLKCITLIHGKEDKIAPVNEIIDITNALPQAKLITFEQTGHLPFLREDFKKLLYEC